MDWRVVYDPKPTTNMSEMRDWEPEHKLVKYRIGDNWKNAKVNENSIEATAIHEMLHVRFETMLRAVSEYGIDSEQANEAEHAAIIVLEGLLLRLSHYMKAEHAELELEQPRVAGDTPVVDRGAGRQARKA